MTQRVVILGGGTAGTLTANRLRRELGGQTAITVVDRDDDHWYQPGLLFVPFGRARPGRIVRSRARQLRPGIGYHQSAVELALVTPLGGAFTRPIASQELGGLLDRKGVQLVTEFSTGEVDGNGGRLVSFDGREVGFDLAVVVPAHGG